jgi:uncharacterized membrane protein
MRNRLHVFWDDLRASYWFIPALMAVFALLASVMTIRLDEGVGRELRWVTGLVYVDSAEGAREVLSTVASSMITVAGVVFSLTMVVLSLSSQQYGPLVLTHFMRDRGNQVVLGVFTATFLYCLLILRTIRGGETDVFVPHISVLVGLILAVASLAVLIYFIHHIARTIQAPNIIARISDELNDKIEQQFPAKVGIETDHQTNPGLQNRLLNQITQDGNAVETRESGYLQIIDDEALLRTASRHDLIIHLDVLPGQFLFPHQTLAHVLPADAHSEQITDDIRDVFIFGSSRTQAQDVEFVITQLSAIAVRSLSPSLNDPYTALMVIDHLGEALCQILCRQQPSQYRYDDEHRLRLIVYPVTFQTLFQTAFDQIIHYGQGDLKVAVRLLRVFQAMWTCTTDADTRNLLRRYATRLYEESQERLTHSEDQRISIVYASLMRHFQNQHAEAG